MMPLTTPLPWIIFKPGDYFVLLLAALLSVTLAAKLWHGGAAQKAVIRAGGSVFVEAPLDRAQRFVVPGPLGNSVIEIAAGRARVAADPSPRQLCVRQGWLSHAGDAALCLPNHLSLELVGATRRYDTLSY